MNEERIIELEIKVTRQEDLLDALNKTVYEQQKKIADLEKLCAELARRLKETIAHAGDRMPANERPPHY